MRKVPIPPELVELLRTHIGTFGVAPDGRLFRSESGNLLQPSTWWQVWQKVRAASLTPEKLASPLMKRPTTCDTRVYARCVVGLEGVWIGRMDQALHLGDDR